VLFLRSWWIIVGMHAEAVKLGARPSRFGLKSDAHCSIKCEACLVCYRVHYDLDAERLITHWNLVAQEVITARHPDHKDSVTLSRLEMF
jgi:hypothetical protein